VKKPMENVGTLVERYLNLGLRPLSYLNINHEPKVKVMTKLMSTTPPILHACYKISKHER
jgi:hypothetical protein